MQLSLISPDRNLRLPHGEQHYVVALQFRKGELDALQNADAKTLRAIVPIITFVGRRNGVPPSGDTTRTWATRLAKVMADNPCYVDFQRLALNRATPDGSSLQARVFDSLRSTGVNFIPVVPFGEIRQAEMLRASVRADRRGVALRLKWDSTVLPTGETLDGALQRMLAVLDVPPGDSDFLLDCGYLDPDRELLARDVAETLREVCKVGDWRSLAFLGTTIPSTMGCIAEDSSGSIPRREWTLWRELRDCGLVRIPAYGDYAIQHPQPPSESGRGMRANIRYTLGEATVVTRAKGAVVQEGNWQYRELCVRLVQLPSFCGHGYSWGDERIADCADGVLRPGAQEMWRGAGTSHHLRFVADQVAKAWS